jgi:hypothetical protein
LDSDEEEDKDEDLDEFIPEAPKRRKTPSKAAKVDTIQMLIFRSCN